VSTVEVPAAPEAAPEVPAEGEQPVEGETPVTAEGDPPAAPAEGEQPTAAAAGEPEIPEATLQAAVEKYAKDMWAQANRTMAAARRAEARAKALTTENATLKEHNGKFAGFVNRLVKGDASALADIGFPSVKSFLDAIAAHGEAKPPSADDRVSELEKRIKDREEAVKAAEQRAVVEREQTRVFDHIASDKSRWKYTGTTRGRDEAWEALGEYVALHGDIDDASVDRVLDAVEASLRAEFGAPQVSPTRPGAKNGGSAAPTASGKTLTNKGASSAPGASEYPLDPDERRRAVNARLKADGLI
jgi:hypothetical protein